MKLNKIPGVKSEKLQALIIVILVVGIVLFVLYSVYASLDKFGQIQTISGFQNRLEGFESKKNYPKTGGSKGSKGSSKVEDFADRDSGSKGSPMKKDAPVSIKPGPNPKPTRNKYSSSDKNSSSDMDSGPDMDSNPKNFPKGFKEKGSKEGFTGTGNYASYPAQLPKDGQTSLMIDPSQKPVCSKVWGFNGVFCQPGQSDQMIDVYYNTRSDMSCEGSELSKGGGNVCLDKNQRRLLTSRGGNA